MRGDTKIPPGLWTAVVQHHAVRLVRVNLPLPCELSDLYAHEDIKGGYIWHLIQGWPVTQGE